MDEPVAVAALAALAQGMRLRIYRALVGAGPQGLTPGVLAAKLGVSASTLSFHLKELSHAGLVSQQRDGRNLIYRPELAHMNALLDYLVAHCCGGAPCGPADAIVPLHPAVSPVDEDLAMTTPAYHVLFICTHNSARSILAEGLLNKLGSGRFKAFSAGSQPAGAVNPLALSTLDRMHMSSDGYRSKDWAEFAQPGAVPMDFVITVCDNAAGEVCPVWPGQPMTAHWGVPDPSRAAGGDELRAQAFWDTAVTLKRRIELMLALPMASLDRLALQREVRDIGAR